MVSLDNNAVMRRIISNGMDYEKEEMMKKQGRDLNQSSKGEKECSQ